jgi:putative membrane protein
MLAIWNYNDHAANERTFLAWLRTGVAVIVFGIVVDKLNQLFLQLLSQELPRPVRRLPASR